MVLFLLLAAAFYFVMMWPRRAMQEYRNAYKDSFADNQDLKSLRMIHKSSATEDERGNKAGPTKESTHVMPSMYGGAPLKRKVGDGAPSRIPTYKDIESAQAAEADYHDI